MTGLSLEVDALLEIALVITDQDLREIAPGFTAVIKPPKSSLNTMSDFVREMHEKSGLLAELENGASLSVVEKKILDYFERNQLEKGGAPMAGNSVWLDRNFIARDLPEVSRYLHYRAIDVSSIKELAKRWYPKSYVSAPVKDGNHRALADIADSIAELRHYRHSIFLPN
jgi:oligoribonuclease